MQLQLPRHPCKGPVKACLGSPGALRSCLPPAKLTAEGQGWHMPASHQGQGMPLAQEVQHSRSLAVYTTPVWNNDQLLAGGAIVQNTRLWPNSVPIEDITIPPTDFHYGKSYASVFYYSILYEEFEIFFAIQSRAIIVLAIKSHWQVWLKTFLANTGSHSYISIKPMSNKILSHTIEIFFHDKY